MENETMRTTDQITAWVIWGAILIGLALCEGSGFLQIFLLGKEYPDTQKLIFVLAVLGVVQFAPTYFKKA
jgi:hypothetical protein